MTFDVKYNLYRHKVSTNRIHEIYVVFRMSTSLKVNKKFNRKVKS